MSTACATWHLSADPEALHRARRYLTKAERETRRFIAQEGPTADLLADLAAITARRRALPAMPPADAAPVAGAAVLKLSMSPIAALALARELEAALQGMRDDLHCPEYYTRDGLAMLDAEIADLDAALAALRTALLTP
jgi:hypothetical protein